MENMLSRGGAEVQGVVLGVPVLSGSQCHKVRQQLQQACPEHQAAAEGTPLPHPQTFNTDAHRLTEPVLCPWPQGSPLTGLGLCRVTGRPGLSLAPGLQGAAAPPWGPGAGRRRLPAYQPQQPGRRSHSPDHAAASAIPPPQENQQCSLQAPWQPQGSEQSCKGLREEMGSVPHTIWEHGGHRGAETALRGDSSGPEPSRDHSSLGTDGLTSPSMWKYCGEERPRQGKICTNLKACQGFSCGSLGGGERES